jgi:hypothetical protein
VTIQWRHESRAALGILALSGHLRADEAPGSPARSAGPSHGAGPLILDLTALHGWSTQGQDAIGQAARRLAAQHRTLELAAAPAGETGPITANAHVTIRAHPDLATALAAHGARAENPGEHHVRHTTCWPHAAGPPDA